MPIKITLDSLEVVFKNQLFKLGSDFDPRVSLNYINFLKSECVDINLSQISHNSTFDLEYAGEKIFLLIPEKKGKIEYKYHTKRCLTIKSMASRNLEKKYSIFKNGENQFSGENRIFNGKKYELCINCKKSLIKS